jgi:hypothetical protein
MSTLLRYWRLWRTLPPDERSARAHRVTDRMLRRNPRWRRLGLAPEQPTWRALGRVLGCVPQELPARLRANHPRRGPLFTALDERAARVARRCPDHVADILAQSRALLERRFDLLGSGPVRPLDADGRIDWHRDFKSGGAWDPAAYHVDLATVRGDGSDVKVPWELSRCQHLLVLGQAWRLAPHVLPVEEAVDLQRCCAGEVRDQVDDWIARNPPGVGVNWTCTMDVGLRTASWLSTLALLRGAPELDDPFLLRWVRALWAHGRFIRAHLEVGGDGLTSNHYLSDIAGLHALARALPELDASEGWLAFTRSAFEQEIERQVHPDGVDFERSVPYHRLVAEMFVHALLGERVAGSDLSPRYARRLALMLEFTATCTRPDGTVPQWGDNDDGRFLPLCGYASHQPHDHRHLLALGGGLLGRADLVAAAGDRQAEALWLLADVERAGGKPAGRVSRAFAEGGYHVLRAGDLHVGVSTGRVGTRGVGNHSHDDLLAVAVWGGGREWVTDPGTGVYTSDPALRNRLRGVAAHATLQLGQLDQNEPGAGIDGLFLVSERAQPEVLEWTEDEQGARLEARHGGFCVGDVAWRHRRRVELDRSARSVRIGDMLERDGELLPAPAPVTVRFPLPPGVTVEPVPDDEPVPPALEGARGAGPAGLVRLVDEAGGSLWLAWAAHEPWTMAAVAGEHSPRYGVVVPATVLELSLPAGRPVWLRTVLVAPRDGS